MRFPGCFCFPGTPFLHPGNPQFGFQPVLQHRRKIDSGFFGPVAKPRRDGAVFLHAPHIVLFAVFSKIHVHQRDNIGRLCGLPYISVLTDPTMGGVSASFAMLGDLNIAEPKALIGFAGPRVIEQTVREKLPPGFQRSEFLIEKGAIDMIVRRPEMRLKLASILAKLMNLPAPVAVSEAPHEGVVVPPAPDQEPEA